MQFIFSTPVLIRHLWQLRTAVLLHRCLICTVPLASKCKPQVPMSWNYCCNLLQYLHFLGLKCHAKLPGYLILSPCTNIIKLLTIVIYWTSVLITSVKLFYNTEWQQCHRMAVRYHAKKFYNKGPAGACVIKLITAVIYLDSMVKP